MTLSNDEIDSSYIDPVIALLFGGGDISAIPREQVQMAHVTLFSGTLINGGLIQYFIDTKGEYVSDLKNGMNIIGESSKAAVVQKALEIFQEQLSRVPENQDYRIVLSGNEVLERSLQKLGMRLDGVDLYQKAMDYARNHLSTFVRQ